MIRRTSLPARSSVLPRSTKPPARRARVKARNARRQQKEKARTYGPKSRREWCVMQDCIACGRVATDEIRNCQAHIKGDGGSRKADYQFITTLCHQCHCVQHDKGWTKLEIEFGFDREEAAARTHAAWLTLTGEAA